MICFKNSTHLGQRHVRAKLMSNYEASSRLIVNSFYQSQTALSTATELIMLKDHDDEARSWFVSFNGTRFVQGHVHATKLMNNAMKQADDWL